jgi:hypothetical protein
MNVERVYNGDFYRALDGWDYPAPEYPGAWTVEGGEGCWIDGSSYGSKISVNEGNVFVGITQQVDFSYADLLAFDLYISYTNPSIQNQFQIRIDGANVYTLRYPNVGLRPVRYDVSWLTGKHLLSLVGTVNLFSTGVFTLARVSCIAHPPPPLFHPAWSLQIGPL